MAVNLMGSWRKYLAQLPGGCFGGKFSLMLAEPIISYQASQAHNKALVRAQTTLRFVCAAQLGRYANKIGD